VNIFYYVHALARRNNETDSFGCVDNIACRVRGICSGYMLDLGSVPRNTMTLRHEVTYPDFSAKVLQRVCQDEVEAVVRI
jgi:hypothetical protein